MLSEKFKWEIHCRFPTAQNQGLLVLVDGPSWVLRSVVLTLLIYISCASQPPLEKSIHWSLGKKKANYKCPDAKLQIESYDKVQMDFNQLLRRTLINYVSASEGKLRKGLYQPPFYVTSSILEISYLIHSQSPWAVQTTWPGKWWNKDTRFPLSWRRKNTTVRCLGRDVACRATNREGRFIMRVLWLQTTKTFLILKQGRMF